MRVPLVAASSCRQAGQPLLPPSSSTVPTAQGSHCSHGASLYNDRPSRGSHTPPVRRGTGPLPARTIYTVRATSLNLMLMA